MGETNVVSIASEGGKALERELKALNEGLPYDRDRIIERTQGAFKRGALAFYDVGRGLILLHDNEGHPFIHILEQYFPGISMSAAKNYMRFARQAAVLPNFKAFCESGGNWSKGLTMLQACSGEELAEFEETGSLRRYKPDEIERMSVRQLQRALRRALEEKGKAVDRATEKLKEQNLLLNEQVEGLEAELQRAGSPLDQALALIKAAENQVLGGIAKLARVPEEVLAREKVVQDMILGMLALGLRALANLETRALVAMAVRQVRDGEVDLDPPCER